MKWSYTTGGKVNGVVYDDQTRRVLCGSFDNKLYCLNSHGEFEWAYLTGDWVIGVVYDPEKHRVFCGSKDNKLYCLNNSGGLEWSYTTGGWVRGVAYDPKTHRVFCGSKDNKLYCFHDNGQVLWKRDTSGITWQFNLALDLKNQTLFAPIGKSIAAIQCGKPVEPLPDPSLLPKPNSEPPENINKILEELEKCRESHSAEAIEKLQIVIDICPELFPRSICTPISKDCIFSVQQEDIQGKPHHVLYRTDQYMQKNSVKYFLEIFPHSIPFIVSKKGDIYFASTNGKIRCYSQGKEFTLFDEHICLPPSIGQNNLLYFSSKDGHLFCIDPEGKGKVWEQRVVSKFIWPSPAVDEYSNAYFADKSTIYIVSTTGKLTQKTLSVPINSPLKIGAQGNLYFLSDSSTLTSIDSNGGFRWSYRIYDFNGVKSPSITTPTFDFDGNIYVGSSNGKIYCINAENGKWMWQATVDNNSSIHFAPTSNDKGEVFFLTEDGSLYRKRNLYLSEKFPFNWLISYFSRALLED